MAKKILLYLSGSLLRIVIFFGLGLVCFSLVFTNPRHIKNLIQDSGIYTGFVDAVISDTIKAQPNSTLPLENQDIQNSLNDEFTPKLLQKNTELFIDSAYDWLDHRTTEPSFTIDFTEARQGAADRIAATAFERVRGLPVCFAIPETFDPFTVGCQPPSTNLSEEQQKLSTAIAGNEGILPKAVFTQNDLPKDVNGTVIYKRYSYAPNVYSVLRLSPIIMSLLLLLAGAGIVLLSKTKRQGFQVLGLSIATSAGALMLTPIIFSFILPNLSKSLNFQTQNSNKSQALINKMTGSLTNDFYMLIINISVQLLALGIVILLVEKFTRPHSRYSNTRSKSGIISSHTKKPSMNQKYKPAVIPVQSSEESTRRKPKRTKNKKYRKIPKKEI